MSAVSGRSDLVDIAAEIRAETKAAVLIFDGTRKAWLPKSQIEIEASGGSALVVVTLPEWLAREKGLL